MIVDKLIKRLHSVFNKDPKRVPVMTVSCAAAAIMTIEGCGLETQTSGDSTPYAVSYALQYQLDTSKYANGPHTLTVQTTDSAGNTTSVDRDVTFGNAGFPTISATGQIVGSDPVSGNCTVHYTTTGENLVAVDVYVDGQYLASYNPTGSFVWNTTTAPNGGIILSLRLRDSMNRVACQDIHVLVVNLNHPAILINHPESNSTATGDVEVDGYTDNSVTGYFLARGESYNLRVEFEAPNYVFSGTWPTSAQHVNGETTVSVYLTYDGHTTKGRKSVTVNNPNYPTLSNVVPADNATLSGVVAISATATSDSESTPLASTTILLDGIVIHRADIRTVRQNLDIDLSLLTIGGLVDALNSVAGYTAQIINNDFAAFAAFGLLPVKNLDISFPQTLYYPTSLFYNEMQTYGRMLDEQAERLKVAEKQLYLNSAEDDWLDFWCKDYFGIPRHDNETDEDYAKRTVYSILRATQNNTALALIIKDAFGIDARIVDAFPHLDEVPAVSPDNMFSVLYTGEGSAATMTINSTTLSTTCTGATGDNVSLAFASYPTIKSIVDHLNATGKYTATMIAVQPYTPSVTLDAITGQSIKTTAHTVVSSNAYAVGRFLLDTGIPINMPYAEAQELVNRIKDLVRKYKAAGTDFIESLRRLANPSEQLRFTEQIAMLAAYGFSESFVEGYIRVGVGWQVGCPGLKVGINDAIKEQIFIQQRLAADDSIVSTQLLGG